MDELKVHHPGDRIAVRFGPKNVTIWEINEGGTPVYRETIPADENQISTPKRALQFCTVRPKWCRLADGHDGTCAP